MAWIVSSDPIKFLADSRAVWVFPLLFGRARVAVGAADSAFIDDTW